MVNDIAAMPEFSRTVSVDQLGSREVVREIEATPAERAALAERLDLIALDSLTATLRLRRQPDGLVRAGGRFAADVVQGCVVTLKPVPARCVEEFTMLFGELSADDDDPLATIDIDPVGDDDPEPIVGGAIDLGEAVAQQLALALDPYPRAPGAEVPPEFSAEPAEGGERQTPNPFAALAKLRDGH